MHEMGKKRPDGKFNVWKKIQVGDHLFDWIIDVVCDSSSEASEYIIDHNKPSKRRYKVNQNA